MKTKGCLFINKITVLVISLIPMITACVSNHQKSSSFDQSKPSYFVSAKGNDNNNGISVSKPFKTLGKAIAAAYENNIDIITIIGTLAQESEGEGFFINKKDTREILITGLPSAKENQRAILSGKGSEDGILVVNNCTLRFEHIELSDGKIVGLLVSHSAQVTLGTGSIIQSIDGFGIVIESGGKVIIDGGEVCNNSVGVLLPDNGTLIMNNGVIKNNNNLRGGGGGVFIHDGSLFTMTGGNITGNYAIVGGGVFVNANGSFIITGGTITGNNAEEGGGVAVNEGGNFDQSGGTIYGNTATNGADVMQMF